MTLDTDVGLIDEALVDHGLNGGQNRLQRVLAGLTKGVDDVRSQDQVPVARVVGEVDARPGRGIDEVVDVLRKRLVDVDDHRVLLLRVEPFGLDQPRLQGDTVGVLEVDQFRLPPRERRHLRAAARDLRERLERGAGDVDIGKLVEALGGDEEDIRVPGPADIAVVLVRGQELHRRRRALESIAIEAGRVRDIVLAAKSQGPGGIDPALVVVFVDGLGPLNAIDHLRLTAFAFGEILRGPAIHEDLPDIEAVVDKERGAVLRPSRSAVARRRVWSVVLFVIESHGDGAGQVPDGAVSCAQRVPVAVREEHGELP